MGKEPAEFPDTFPYFTDFPEALRNYKDKDWKKSVCDVWEAMNKAHDDGNRIIGFDRDALVPPQHVLNGNFGRWENGTTPDNWTVDGTVTTTTKVAGRPAGLIGEPNFNSSGLKIRVAGANFAGYKQVVRFQPGEIHSLSGFVRLDASEAGQNVSARMRVVCDTGDDKSHTFEYPQRELTAWTGFPSERMDAFTIRIPVTATEVTIYLHAKNGTATFCDVGWSPGLHRNANRWHPSYEDREKYGRWTPAATGIANITAVSANTGTWTRCGPFIDFNFIAVIDPAVPGGVLTQARFSLPTEAPATFAAATDCNGQAMSPPINTVGEIVGNVAFSEIQINFLSDAVGAQNTWRVSGRYRVI